MSGERNLTYAEKREIIIAAYRRIIHAAEKGKGVRLSAQECDFITNVDFAVVTAVAAADEETETDEDTRRSVRTGRPANTRYTHLWNEVEKTEKEFGLGHHATKDDGDETC